MLSLGRDEAAICAPELLSELSEAKIIHAP